MQSVKKIGVLALVLLFLASCVPMGAVQDKWNKLTPGEKARVILGGIQKDLDQKFDQGKAYVTLYPQHQAKWKTRIVPAFDTANKTLAASIQLAMAEKLSPDQAYAKMQPLITQVLVLLVEIGVLKPVQTATT